MIWRPHAFGPTGTPLIPQAPPELRVEGGIEPSSLTRNQAQQAFAQFCTDARLSQVPNPTRTGRLPDGTPYRIVTVGPQTIMQIWPQQGDDDRLSGIAITLVNVDGSVIPGHFDEDGEPIKYLLTPQLTKDGSRISNGKWRVRKPPRLVGGKAVNGGPDGKAYFTGVQGELDQLIPLLRNSRYGVNGLAYDNEDDGVNATVSRQSRALGSSRDNPIPFRYRVGGQSFDMQLLVRREEEEAGTAYYLDLYAGPPGRIDGAQHFGALVETRPLNNDRIDAQSITFSADGARARAYGTKAGMAAFIDIAITPTGVSYTSTNFAQSNTTGFTWDDTQRAEESGTPGVPGVYRVEGWRIYGPFPGTEYGSTRPAVITSPYNVGGGFGEGELDFVYYDVDSHTFDRRGRPDAGAADRFKVHYSLYTSDHAILTTTITALGPPFAFRVFEERDYDWSTRRIDTRNTKASSGTTTLVSTQDSYKRRTTSLTELGVVVSTTDTVQGSGNSTAQLTSPGPLFEDAELDFGIYYGLRTTRDQEWTWQIIDNGTAARVYTKDEVTTQMELTVTCRGVKLLDERPDLDDIYRHVIFLASDPMTGALVVNLQEVNPSTRAKRRSWIFAVDDQGGKGLGQIMDLPNNARTRTNAELFSV